MKTRLVYPAGLRFPHDDEFPGGNDVAALKREFAAAEIVVGYRARKTSEEVPFGFFAEVNVEPERVFDVFADLAALLPESDCRALASAREEAVFESEPGNRDAWVAHFSKFRYALSNDAWLQFGIVHEEARLIEVLVTQTKYIQFWGDDESAFTEVMRKHGLEQNSDLAFFDEFPTITIPLPAPHPRPEVTLADVTEAF